MPLTLPVLANEIKRKFKEPPFFATSNPKEVGSPEKTAFWIASLRYDETGENHKKIHQMVEMGFLLFFHASIVALDVIKGPESVCFSGSQPSLGLYTKNI